MSNTLAGKKRALSPCFPLFSYLFTKNYVLITKNYISRIKEENPMKKAVLISLMMALGDWPGRSGMRPVYAVHYSAASPDHSSTHLPAPGYPAASPGDQAYFRQLAAPDEPLLESLRPVGQGLRSRDWRQVHR